MAKWIATTDAQWQAAFKRDVTDVNEAALKKLGLQYRAALDAAIAKASSASDLVGALALRKEQKRFAETNAFAEQDEPDGAASARNVRAAFRVQSAQLEKESAVRAKALLAKYDQVLAQAQSQLTQRQRLDDALLVKNKRDEVAAAWTRPAGGKAEPAAPALLPPPGPAPATVPKGGGSLMAATKDKPFVNTLGMKFVPVPITGGPTDKQRVLFSVWDTRIQDYEVFSKATGHEWIRTTLDQGPTHPVVNVSWDEAQAFCTWLTESERKAGQLGANELYRLPTDHEWSCAVGIGDKEDAAKLPSEKDAKIPSVYPWGTTWPPPAKSGNYWSEELRPLLAAGKYPYIPANTGEMSGYTDGFATTSPVGSFAPNRFGLFDLGGNLWQWCEDWFDKDQKEHVTRGASWSFYGRSRILSSARNHNTPDSRNNDNGFRLVLAPAPAR